MHLYRLVVIWIAMISTILCGIWFVPETLFAQSVASFKTSVDLVVLSLRVVDGRGHYVTGLQPSEFKVIEDGIPQKISTFVEGNKAPVQLAGDLSRTHPDTGDSLAGTNVFLLFNTSNMMYREFVYAEDAIATFIRGMDKEDSVALYTFSRNMTRAAALTSDRNAALAGLRQAIAGDESALYDALLLTLRDANKVSGRKVVIVFSNGPDNASMIPPDDVAEVAENAGIPIYIISTKEMDPDSAPSKVFSRITLRTGGKVYWARTWQKQVQAFESIRNDLSSTYVVAYYPAPNRNHGFRRIHVEIANDAGKKLRVLARNGYRSRPVELDGRNY